MRRAWQLLLCVSLALAAAFLLSPSLIDPAPYLPQPGPALTGTLEENRRLQAIELLGRGLLPGPEDVEVDRLGRLYTGLEDGSIRRLEPGSGSAKIETFSVTGGRPLGLDRDAAGILWVADAQLGLLTVDEAGTVTIRSDRVAGRPVGFADDVDVDDISGLVYFSDASTRFGQADLILEALEARPHGRLLMYDPSHDKSHELLEGLFFANGVAVENSGRYVLVAETFRYRIRRLWLAGPRAGEAEIFMENLPGFPDGISSTDRGTFWIAIHSLRSPLLDRVLHPRTWLKRLIAKLPRSWLRAKAGYGLVLEVDDRGRVLRSLHDPGGDRFSSVTSVEEFGDSLYLGTVEGSAVGRVPVP